jgi:hypothetical protein
VATIELKAESRIVQCYRTSATELLIAERVRCGTQLANDIVIEDISFDTSRIVELRNAVDALSKVLLRVAGN